MLILCVNSSNNNIIAIALVKVRHFRYSVIEHYQTQLMEAKHYQAQLMEAKNLLANRFYD